MAIRTFADIDAMLAPGWIVAVTSTGPWGIRLQLQRKRDNEYMLPGGIRCVEADTLESAAAAAADLTNALGDRWAEKS